MSYEKIEIVKDLNFLNKKTEKVASINEAEIIASMLFEELKKHKGAVGLAANQLGINKAVCVINVLKPIWLMNPVILMTENVFNYKEGCLSIPNTEIITKRFLKIRIKADNFNDDIIIDLTYIPENKINSSLEVLECVCFQHEIDHLFGITILNRELKNNNDLFKKPFKKINNNEIILMEKDGITMKVKRKKMNRFIKRGFIIKDGE